MGQLYPYSERTGPIIPDDPSSPVFDENERWRHCKWPIEMFNIHYASVLYPATILGPDEYMSWWLGQQAKLGPACVVKPNMCPNTSFVTRKPRPVGGEHKCMADSGSGIINRIEIMEGAASHAGQEYYDEWGYTSALNLRLSKPWHVANTSSHKHIDLGDAHFMGVDELEALLIKVKHALSILYA